MASNDTRPLIDLRRWLAELVIIVAGVLIALWIGDVRQDRLDRATEVDYLQRLEADLQLDLDEVDRVVRHSENRVAAARRALAFMKETPEADAETGPGAAPEPGSGAGAGATADELALFDVIDDFDRAGYITFFSQAQSTWDDLLGTGNLKLIRNRDLRQAMSRYYRSTRFIEEFDQSKIEQIWHEYRLELDRHISPLLILEHRDTTGPAELDLASVDIGRLRASERLRLMLEKIVAMAAVERRMTLQVRDRTLALLDAVRAER